MATGVVSSIVGEIKPIIGTTVPTGWLLCNGAAVNRGTAENTDYWDLWQALSGGTGSSPWGNGNGSTTFNLPDLRGRCLVGAATTGEVGTLGGEENVTLNLTHIPSHTHTFTVGQAGSHTHSGTTGGISANHTHLFQPRYTLTGEHTPDGSGFGAALLYNIQGATASNLFTSGSQTVNHTHSFTTNSIGSHTHTVTFTGTVDFVNDPWVSGSHANMPPYLVVNWIIKY